MCRFAKSGYAMAVYGLLPVWGKGSSKQGGTRDLSVRSKMREPRFRQGGLGEPACALQSTTKRVVRGRHC